ncbi:MAG TPA: hypothetical protein VJ376_03175 [Pseudomonadota bacterium]|nr:hypothetical protein [Pseudomonadota bacterium]
MGSLSTTSYSPKSWLVGLSRAVAQRLAKLTRVRSDVSAPESSNFPRVRATLPLNTEPSTDDVSLIVITACYESYLNMREMLAVLAMQRGDDPDDALGPPPE